MEYLYGNNATCLEKIWRDGLSRQLEVTEAALNYGISQLTLECYRLLRTQLSHATCALIYKFAQVLLYRMMAKKSGFLRFFDQIFAKKIFSKITPRGFLCGKSITRIEKS
jgi:hypothetical protein